MKKRLSYIACPYSHKEYYITVARFLAVNRFAAEIISTDHLVFSPISHTHPIVEAKDLPKSWEFWECYDKTMLGCCDDVIVLCLPEWEQSIGVQEEIKLAREFEMPIDFIQYELSPSFENLIEIAKSQCINPIPIVKSYDNKKIIASSFNHEGSCDSPTNVCSIGYNV
jgi:hypothetical protein